MNFHMIDKDDLKNGEGIRCVLWVAGCNHHCPGCQNEWTQDPAGGELFRPDHMTRIIELCSEDYCDGLTLSGGDPMYPPNRSEVYAICKMFRTQFGSTKTIWMYTGYTLEEIADEPVLDLVDVVVDGPYIEAQRNTQRYWCGSDNQTIWRKLNGHWHPDPPEYVTSLSDEQHEKEKGCDC